MKSVKKNTTKKALPPIGSKPTKTQIKKVRASTIKMVKAHTIAGNAKTPYSALQKDHGAFRAHTIAAMVVANCLAISAKGTPSKPAKGKPETSLLRGLIGSAFGNWVKLGRLEKSGLITVKGMNEVSASFAGMTKGYNTDTASVKTVSEAMKKGGQAEINGTAYSYTSAVNVMAAK